MSVEAINPDCEDNISYCTGIYYNVRSKNEDLAYLSSYKQSSR